MLRISVDLLGGDSAPTVVLNATQNFDSVHFVFVGNADALAQIKNYEITHYSTVEAHYRLAEGQKVSKSELQKSSMYVAIMQVKDGNADCVLSGGPSGYYLLLCRQILGTLNGVNRPAIATTIPTTKGFSIMMDLGANVTCDENDLVKFGIMGISLAQFWLGVAVPKVGFVNVGSEQGKGPDSIKNAAAKFEKLNPDCFGGFVEGHQIMQGTHDVAVVDGFTGNCILKFGEGAFIFFKDMFKQAFKSNLILKLIGLIARKKLKDAMLDPRKFNGALFAGINGCAVKSHGGSDAIGYRYAVEFAIKIGRQKTEMIEKMNVNLERFCNDIP